MNKLRLLTGASLRSQIRWASEHFYYWLVLGPLVVGFTTLTVARVVDNLADLRPAPVAVIATAILLELGLVALSLSRAASEIYHLRRPEAYFDALPIDPQTHLHAAIASRSGRTLLVALTAIAARWMIGAPLLSAAMGVPAVLFVALTSLAQMLASLHWIHWGHTKRKMDAAIALLVLVPTTCLGGLLFFLIVNDEIFSSRTRLWLCLAAGSGVIFLYLIIRQQHARWRAADSEYARRLQSSNSLRLVSVARLRRRLSHSVAAQLARDMQLTLRGFSSAVYVAGGIVALLVAGMVAALTTGMLPPAPAHPPWLDLTWTPQALAIKAACAVTVSVLTSLVPLLVAYELPMMWMERATDVTGLDMCAAKLWYARAVSFIAPLAVWLAGVLTGQIAISYLLPLLAECLWLWWMISSMTGLLAFEMPARPGLAIIVMTTANLAAASLAVIFWPAGIIIHVQAMHGLTDRGRHMARFYLLTEDD